jgi:hypothetical protein
MIVLQINLCGVYPLECEGQAPVPQNGDRKAASLVAVQGMKAKSAQGFPISPACREVITPLSGHGVFCGWRELQAGAERAWKARHPLDKPDRRIGGQLDLVAQGAAATITRRGKAVARSTRAVLRHFLPTAALITSKSAAMRATI